MATRNRLKKAWNAFLGFEQEQATVGTQNRGPSYTTRPDKPRFRFFSERSIVSSIYTRISIDVAGVPLRHVRLDEDDRYLEDIDGPLQQCFQLEANLDQSPRAFRQDLVMTLCDKGVAAIVPVDTSENPNNTDKYDIYTLRVGEIVEWFPKHVRVSVYNENRGMREEIVLEKSFVAIVENPLYAVMNEPNSTLQRLIRKLSLLDNVDEASAGKLDLIIQLPYVIKSESRRTQAEKRREEIEFQLKQSQYGIAYTDGTERVTQLNRPAENQLLKQVEYLTDLLYSQLGITAEVMNGTADEKAMLNYNNRTMKPFLDAIVEAMTRAFLGPVGYKNQERILYFRDPFALVPIIEIAEVADVFSRNEIFAPNEIRGFMGIKPSQDPQADELHNSNMPDRNMQPVAAPGPTMEDMDSIINEVFSGLTSDIDKLAQGV